MTTKHLNGYYANGYTLSSNYSKLLIERTADVRGSGVDVPSFATVVNFGAVYGDFNGVYLESGGRLVNGSAKHTGASITGGQGNGVTAHAVAAIVNFGTVTAGYDGDGVLLDAGGALTNGSTHDTTALISSNLDRSNQSCVSASELADIANFGTIDGGVGVSLGAGGSVTNGSISDTTALIYGNHLGVSAGGVAIIANFGTIAGDGVSLGGGVP